MLFALLAAAAQLQAAPSRHACVVPRSTPAAEGLSAARVQEFVDSARATGSDAVVILRNGKLVAEWYSDSGRTPTQTMSATKSIVGLAIGRLLHDGLLDSLDQPVWTIYPEWRQGRKRQITIRHLLNHTSGLQDVPSDTPEIEPAPDAVQLALAAELMTAPGTAWFYSNKATNLLSGIVQKRSGMPLDEYVRKAFLAPMCVTDASWPFRDKVGTPYGMAGLSLRAIDFARFGQLMLNGGTWHGERLLPESWVAQSVAASQPIEPRYGLLWWVEPEWTQSTIDSTLLRTWSDARLPTEIIQALTPLSGKRFGPEWRGEWAKALAPVGGTPRFATLARDAGVPIRRIIVGPSRGYSANGSLGQWLVVLPDEKLVIARQLKRRSGLTERNFFSNLPALAMRLLAPK